MVQTQSVGAVVLAAGSSSRMGRPKQTLQFKGESLLRRAVQAAIGGGCDPVIVVTGAHADLSRRELKGLDVREVLNTSWETGMASSVRAGVEGIADADAVVLLLCDQPHVTLEVISDLIAAYRSTGKPIIASTYGELFRSRFASRLWARRIASTLRQPQLLELGCAVLRLPGFNRLASHIFFGRGSFPDATKNHERFSRREKSSTVSMSTLPS